MGVLPSPTAVGPVWSLMDSYGFIATFLTRSRCRRRIIQTAWQGPNDRRWSSTREGVQQRLVGNHDGLSSSSRWKRGAVLHQPRPHLPSPLHPHHHQPQMSHHQQYRLFHDYFVTHLPSSSLHPDSRSARSGLHHKLPRSAATPHPTGPAGGSRQPAAAPPPSMVGAGSGTSRELTVVRIPLRSAKHHFGAANSRGTRPYNEDSFQAGTIEMPAFARRAPMSLSRKGGSGTNGPSGSGSAGGKAKGAATDGPIAGKEATSAEGASGDPQVFYFGVFDGHGGQECSAFLKEELHTYIEKSAVEFEVESSLRSKESVSGQGIRQGQEQESVGTVARSDELASTGKESLDNIQMKSADEVKAAARLLTKDEDGRIERPKEAASIKGQPPETQSHNKSKVDKLQRTLVSQWKNTVGGYFRRFKPDHFNHASTTSSVEAALTYAFLSADLDFVTAQASKKDPDGNNNNDNLPLNHNEVFGRPSQLATSHRIGGPTRFMGGSTASIALISTPTPTPFWHPASPSTMLIAHVGDTRVLLCATATGLAVPLTTNHHPSSPVESTRLRRYAATFVTDSFGEERMSGLANTRAFGDMKSKRIGVSAEPEIRRVELLPAEYSFLVLVSDGVSGSLSDQEIVDLVKEAKTPEQASRDVVAFAGEVSRDGDNATCLVVRLGGWERRSEGGLGSLGTKEGREWRRGEAADPRSRRT